MKSQKLKPAPNTELVPIERSVEGYVSAALHHSHIPYLPSDVWSDLWVQKLCEAVGTNPLALKNQNFGVELYIQPGLSYVPEEMKPASPAFVKMVADELLHDQRFVNDMELVRKFIQKDRKLYGFLMNVDKGILSAGIMTCFADMINFSMTRSSLLGFEVLPVLIASHLVVYRVMRGMGDPFITANNRVEDNVNTTTAKLWSKAAKEHGLSRVFVFAERHAQGRGMVKGMEKYENNQGEVRDLVHGAEDWAISHAAPDTHVFTVEGQSQNRELGTTTMAMKVFSPSPEPPDFRKKKPEKIKPNPAWSWLGGLVPRPA